MTYVRTRLALDRLQPGDTLRVRLRGAEPLRNVPVTAEAQGHVILNIESMTDGSAIVTIRKG